MHHGKKSSSSWTKKILLISTLALGLSAGGGALAALLNIDLTAPLITFDNTGTTSYNPSTDTFDVRARPLALLLPDGTLVPVTGTNSFNISVVVDSAGQLTGGVAGNDIEVVGTVSSGQTGDLTGQLLAGEVIAFGFEDNPGPIATDVFDFRFVVTGGLLAGLFPEYAVGSNVGVELTSEESNFQGDFSLAFTGEAKGNLGAIPADCSLDVQKTCIVPPPPPPSGGKCDGKLQQFTVIWNGGEPITVSGPTNDATGGVVNTGQEVTFTGPFSQNDVEVQLSGAANGTSTFHMSCSDDDFNDPSDCGKAAGDGKKSSGGVNDWLLEGFIDKNGSVLDCTADNRNGGGPTSQCTLALSGAPNCDTAGKPKDGNLIFQYTGGGCSASNNSQGSKATCSGSIDGNSPASLSVSDGASASPGKADPGGEFVVSGISKSNTVFTLSNAGGSQTMEIHTSCSQPLNAGDVYGGLTLVGINGQRDSSSVTYEYLVSNNSAPGVTVGNISVEDDKLGTIASGITLASGDSTTLSAAAPVGGTVTNIVTVMGTSSGGQCEDMDSATVTVTAASAACAGKVKKGKCKVKKPKKAK